MTNKEKTIDRKIKQLIGKYLKYVPGIGWEMVCVYEDNIEEPFQISNETSIELQEKGMSVLNY